MKKRIFIDMDGTLCEWNPEASIEEVARSGYFKQCKPIESTLYVTKALLQDPDIEVYILSAVFQDDHSIQDKNYWLDMHGLEGIDMRHRIFCPCGVSKSVFLNSILPDCSKKDFLLDDFTHNLLEWHGIGIKVYNGINGSKKRWTGYSLRSNCDENVMLNTLKGILHYASEDTSNIPKER